MKYVLISFFLFGLSFLQAQNIIADIDAYANTYLSTGDFSGCIRISKQDSILYKNCFGYANHSFKIPNDKNTKFKIGSVSKQFTAAAILLLEQQNQLKTTDALSEYFPTIANAAKISIEQLLTHTSGLPDIFNIQDFNIFSCQDLEISTLATIVLESDLQFEPGAQYQYSNGGYAVLAAIIEKISGKTYGAYLKEHIFDPLKMMDSGHGDTNQVITKLAEGYDPKGYDSLKLTEFIDPELLKGGGSLYSTLADLQSWINSIKNETLLSPASYKKFLNDYGNGYGYGISIYSSFDKAVFGHDGRINGYIADYLHYREDDITVLILGNIQTGVADFFRRDVAAIVFGQDYKSRAKTERPASNSPTKIQALLGSYSFGPNFKVYVELFDGVVQARANEGGYSELVPLEDGRFFSRMLYSYIDFKADTNGSISKMLWTNNNGNTFEGLKD
ncbi:MAG: beta-lactamase family protein [Croceitalea sp.]|nr:beta-lactamase family protein [Croceitalea sp.]